MNGSVYLGHGDGDQRRSVIQQQNGEWIQLAKKNKKKKTTLKSNQTMSNQLHQLTQLTRVVIDIQD